MPKIVYHDSDEVEKVLVLKAEPVLIGRGTECQIRTDDALVSRRHALLFWDGNYVIEDLGSSNGVYLGGEKVSRAPIRPGDTVTCGSLVLKLLPDTRSPARLDADPRANTAEGPGELERRLRGAPSPDTTSSESDTGAKIAEAERQRLAARVVELEARAGEQLGPAATEVALALADALAELRARLRVATDEAALLTAQAGTAPLLVEALRAASEQLEAARDRLREFHRRFGAD